MIYRFRLISVLVLTITTTLLGVTWYWYRPEAPPPYRGSSYRNYDSGTDLPLTDYAIATFLTGQTNDDAYLVATRVMAHQLLHANATKCDPDRVTFLVLCSESVPKEQKDILRNDGATVVELRNVPVNWWIKSVEDRWKEQFTKLRIFEMTEYKRILFMDADTLITDRIEEIFDEPELAELVPTQDRQSQVKWGESRLPGQWLFASRPDNGFTGRREHSTPPLQTDTLNAGFFVAAPDRLIYQHMLSVMGNYRRFDPYFMEQSLLNYVFRREGLMPWRELNWKWSATWPNEKDFEMGVVTLHEKLWETGPQPLQDMWNRKKGEMLNFHDKKHRRVLSP